MPFRVTMTKSDLQNRIKGAWVGQAIGRTYGGSSSGISLSSIPLPWPFCRNKGSEPCVGGIGDFSAFPNPVSSASGKNLKKTEKNLQGSEIFVPLQSRPLRMGFFTEIIEKAEGSTSKYREKKNESVDFFMRDVGIVCFEG